MTRQFGSVLVDMTVLLGRTRIPVQHLLRMGRGAVIPLNTHQTENVWILANGHPVARGEVLVEEGKVSVNIVGSAQTQDYFARSQTQDW